jgi:hypothetical protein
VTANRFAVGGKTMLIGISGHAGSGKGVAADALVQSCGWVKVALADPMKRMCADAFDWPSSALWGPSEERNKPDPARNGLTPRKALQLLGTEWGRACYPDVWIDYALSVARALQRGGHVYSPRTGLQSSFMSTKNVVIDDVRFDNERVAIQKAGGKVVRIKRPTLSLIGAPAVHTSETEQDAIPDAAFDAVIYNDGSIDQLRARTLAVVNHLMQTKTTEAP